MTQAIITDKFRGLMLRLVDEKLITPPLINLAYEYLFGDDGSVPFFVQTELFNAVIYLKDLMTSNKLSTLDDIIGYFDRKRRALASFIDGLGPSEDVFEFKPTSKIQWEKPSASHENNDMGEYPSAYSCYMIRPLCLLPAPVRSSCAILLPASFGVVNVPDDSNEKNEIKSACN